MAENQLQRLKPLALRAARNLWFAHSARTAMAAVASLAIAHLLTLPEAYWAPITTLIVMQSTVGAAWTASKHRLIGTALGAAMGALLAAFFGPGIVVFGLAVFVLGLICAALRLDGSAYRFASITIAILLLIVRTEPPWIASLHRFVEVSIGIAVALIITALWPQREPPAGQ
jgi:uncharacterized membrane protein YccC